MIPYDDLVTALSTWRARQGLPVNTVGGGGLQSAPTTSPGSGPHGTPGSGPNRAAPPGPPPASSSGPGSSPGLGMPVAAALADEPLEVADELLDDEAYENEGGDFALGFDGAPAVEPEATAISTVPERPTETDMGNDRDDW